MSYEFNLKIYAKWKNCKRKNCGNNLTNFQDILICHTCKYWYNGEKELERPKRWWTDLDDIFYKNDDHFNF